MVRKRKLTFPKKTRELYGKKYELANTYKNRKVANDIARDFRKVGYFARVISLTGQYAVYIRKKKRLRR